MAPPPPPPHRPLRSGWPSAARGVCTVAAPAAPPRPPAAAPPAAPPPRPPAAATTASGTAVAADAGYAALTLAGTGMTTYGLYVFVRCVVTSSTVVPLRFCVMRRG